MRSMPSRRREKDIGLPPSMMTTFQGAALAFQATLGNELLLILAALVTVYIVLGVLYESFIHPITILSTLPSAGVGALLALLFAGDDLGVIGIIGIILLIGIVKKNAIMMIDFALVAEREQGMSPRDAIYRASLLRFRPILMTTMAALLGALPLMLGTRHGLGTAPSARHHHRRRPDREPAADALHHARDLPVLRPPGAPRRAGAWSTAARPSAAGGAMNLSEPFIRRPVATTLLTVGVALAGILAYTKLPVSPLPQVDSPTIAVSRPWRARARMSWRPPWRRRSSATWARSPTSPR